MRDAPTREPHADEDMLGRVLEKLQAFLLRNGLHILIVAGLIVISVLAVRLLALHRRARAVSQWAAVGRLSQTSFLMLYPPEQAAQVRQSALAQCSNIIDTEKRTSATPWILLEMGNLFASGEQWSEAANTYRRIVEQYPGEPAAEMARDGLAVALEATAQYGEAAGLYERLAEAGAAPYLIDAGRCRELAGDVAGARAAYEKAIKADLAEDLRALAEARLVKLEAGQPLPPPPEPKALEPEAAAEPAGTPPAGLFVPAETPNAEAPESPAPGQPENGPAH